MSRIFHLVCVILAALGLTALFLVVLPAQQRPLASKQAAINQAVISVNTLEDEDNNDGDCSLREAILAANENISVDGCTAGKETGDTISFSVSGSIVLNSQLNVTAGGPLLIDGAGEITTDGNLDGRHFYVNAGAELTLEGLTLVDGYVINSQGGGIYNLGDLTLSNSTLSGNRAMLTDGYGGAIANYGSLSINNSTLSGNRANNAGGSIYNQGTLTVTESTLSSNSLSDVLGPGGGIFNGDWRPLAINNSTLTDNQAGLGGGIYNDGTLTITNSTLSGNVALYYGGGISNLAQRILNLTGSTLTGNRAGDSGGGIENSGFMTIFNSTLTENNAEINGGGIYNYWVGIVTIANSTLSGNSSSKGGGIYNLADPLTVHGSIIANSPTGNNCAGDAIIDGGYNLDSQNTCAFNPAKGSLVNTDPLLGALEDNGGRTLTHALLDGSPAVDSGDSQDCPPSDQRHAPRPFDGDGDGTATCDIGAYERVDLITLYPASQNQSRGPGVTVVYDLELNNFTELTDTYTLDLGSHAWDTSLLTATIGPLSGEDTQSFTVSVDIPASAPWHMTDTVILTAASTTSPTQYFAIDQITTQVYIPPQVSFSSTELSSIQHPNEIITVPWTISNGYGVPLTFRITPQVNVPWLSLDPISGTVDTNDSKQVLAIFDSHGVSPGEYPVGLDFNSNRPNQPIMTIDAEMTVMSWKSFLPLVVFPPKGIYGYVTENGVPAYGINLELRFYDGSDWSTLATTTTDPEGRYVFVDIPDLSFDQAYYVLFRNLEENPNHLWAWGTNELLSYHRGDSVNNGNFDIANIELLSPQNEGIVSLPYTFRWRPRPSSPSDSYEFNLYFPWDLDPYFWTDPPLGYVGSYTLSALPPGFGDETWYVWEMWAYSPDGGFGISFETRWVAFVSEEQKSLLSSQMLRPKILPDREYLRKK